jgi:hypothetical protein
MYEFGVELNSILFITVKNRLSLLGYQSWQELFYESIFIQILKLGLTWLPRSQLDFSGKPTDSGNLSFPSANTFQY